MTHKPPADPRESGGIDDQMSVTAELDVRSADHDLAVFADRIAATLAEDKPAIIDVSQHEDGGNRIVLRVHQPPTGAAG